MSISDFQDSSHLAKVSVEKINVPKAANLLANALREKIFGGELGVGMELPSERELGEQAHVSRATVREALRILESEGLIETRLGRRGGSSVLLPGSAAIERSVGIFIRGHRIRLQAVLETRMAIEPTSARLAAEHCTAEDFDELERCQERVERASRENNVDAYIQANLDWHVQVVRASHNELLIAFISAVSKAMYLESDIKGFSSSVVRDAVIHAHRRVMDAIRDGDADAAARRMGRHVDAYAEDIQKTTAPVAAPSRRSKARKTQT